MLALLQALSGFKLYMYPGVALNRAEDMLPVKSEIQSIVATNLVPAGEQQVRAESTACSVSQPVLGCCC
jgi:hypothetical protein